ncbi:hypothetical protein FHS96_001701 [Sphingomonas zeicaulis]|uniref:hypothetical protein n=1 Tax=Sphingomonas zeicaulis TaxID=1632740 RepID=UPI003D21D1A7
MLRVSACPGFSPVHPRGFLPIIEPCIWDVGATIGLRGDVNAVKADLSQSFGSNKADFRVFDTANPSLGADSPTRFDAGSFTYRQYVCDLTVSMPLDGVLAGGMDLPHCRRRARWIRRAEPRLCRRALFRGARGSKQGKTEGRILIIIDEVRR